MRSPDLINHSFSGECFFWGGWGCCEGLIFFSITVYTILYKFLGSANKFLPLNQPYSFKIYLQ